MKQVQIIVFLFFYSFVFGQEKNLQELTYNEYLGYVKKYHPMVKSANLEVNSAQTNLMICLLYTSRCV